MSSIKRKLRAKKILKLVSKRGRQAERKILKQLGMKKIGCWACVCRGFNQRGKYGTYCIIDKRYAVRFGYGEKVGIERYRKEIAHCSRNRDARLAYITMYVIKDRIEKILTDYKKRLNIKLVKSIWK